MSLREHIVNAVRSLRANKMRAVLSSLGIIIGVSSVIILLAFGEGTQRTIMSSIEALGTNILTLVPGNTSNTDARKTNQVRSSVNVFNELDVKSLSGFQNVRMISPVINGNKVAIYKNKNTSTSVYGVTPEYTTVRNTKVDFGNFISNEDVQKGSSVAVIGIEVVKSLFDGKNPIGEKIRIDNTFFTVIGVLESKGSNSMGNSDNIVLIPISTASSRIFGTKYYSQVVVMVDDGDKIDETKETITDHFLQRFGISNPDDANFSVISSADMLSAIQDVTAALSAFLGGIAAISLIVGGIGVMNIMLVSVSERTREIGIRRSIGALNRDIIFQFLTESVMLTLLGGAVGILFSSLVVFLMQSFGVEAYITPGVVLLSFSCAVGTGIIFGLLPARKASKLKPIDALRSD